MHRKRSNSEEGINFHLRGSREEEEPCNILALFRFGWMREEMARQAIGFLREEGGAMQQLQEKLI